MIGHAALVTAIAAFVACAVATPVLRRLALRWELTDRPGGHKSHRRPTPYLGGIAIMLATVVPPLALAGPAVARIAGILVGAVAMALLGLIDDIAPLPPPTRLAVQTLAAGVVVVSGVVAPVTGSRLDMVITLLWIVVVSNSFNLLDNMDGALGGVTVVGAALLSAAAFVSGQPETGLLLAALSPAALGFLLYNWAPARIFMGDAGSLFIGFTLTSSAALVVSGAGPGTATAGLLLPAFVAIVDTGIVMLARSRAGRPLLQGGSDHLSHRLHRLGLGKRLTALALAALAGAAGLVHLATTLGWVAPVAAAAAAGAAGCVVVVLAQRVRVYPSIRPKTAIRVRR
ncbi:glycosyltransferase family 4 protein [Microbispora bryophytorum]|uniref:Undecaprenyl-phosphate alpha-N-acetylglucosaminyl 1-phosphate transferase n=1 Tax=Microbispora bryophytorum TaxID=1460882 RepID=A0A8H9LFS2_9ACTN|nr:MraY family glycosyltransferase [Microbispora bryophytorum]MBD3139463.1 undecaprenyl/decaprenyl-phosphate alpha-N-acetylglucosaminyl 1-phosphate transferase [Microbispora bryophytorum]TQS04475.1 undecaprenyl/decaprenyl-phosphate alpha-N-acetylglucosaminyl 1-phosphate transferase [Microbispora bryophytorum]GGO23630.1 undecaprenyl-phosphate alpha-N-acetylglucosaminyl 1-phosphate transferase [Microbispora bryophytorum]